MGTYSFAESNFEPGIIVATHKMNYDNGDAILISGKVSSIIKDTGISIQIWKEGKVFKIGYALPDKDRKFSDTIIADGKGWDQGTYVVVALYGQENIAETTFTLGKFEPAEELVDPIQESPTKITIKTNDIVYYLNSTNSNIQADVEIQNYSPNDGLYFIKIIHIPTQKILKIFEVQPIDSGFGLWTAQIVYPIQESEIITDDQTLFGEFELQINTEYGFQTATTTFSILETPDELNLEMMPKPEETAQLNSEENFPIITEILKKSNQIHISWTQDEPKAPSFDVVIDGHDTGNNYRTISNSQTVDSGECFTIQARYPDSESFLMSDEVCLDPEPISENKPIITEILKKSNQIQISWTQDEPKAPSFDIVIDGGDTGTEYRTSLTSQMVDSGECFTIQARYPDEEIFFRSDEVCLDPEPTLETNNPIITEIVTKSNQIQISWTQDEPKAPSFDIVIDGDDTGSKYRTSLTSQLVVSGECFTIQARYSDEDIFVNSDEVCFGPKPIPEGFDRFGIIYLYPTADRIFESHWDMGGPRVLYGQQRDQIDPELKLSGRNPELVIDGKGIATMQGEIKNEIADPRMFVYDPALKKKWENTEITIYMMRVSEHVSYSYSGLNVNSRSEHQDSGKDPNKGQSYTGRFIHDGRTMFVKEIIHGEYYENADKRIYPWSTSNKKMPYHQWIGLKLITYDLPNGNVKLELYMDLTDGVNGGNWEKTNEFIDNGTWADRIFTDPATSVWIKNDGLGVAKYKNFSVREIIPPN